MSGTFKHHDARDVFARPPERIVAVWDVIVPLVLTIAAIGGVTAVASGLIRGVGIDQADTIFLAAVLLISVICGLRYGLVAALIALAMSHFVLGRSLAGMELSHALLLGLFGLGVLIAGLYADDAHRRGRAASAGTRLATPSAATPSSPANGGTPQDIRRRRQTVFLRELRGGLIAFLIVGAALALGVVFKPMFGDVSVTLVVFGSVLVVAAGLGSRFGFAAGLFAALIMSGGLAPMVGKPMHLHLETAVSIVVFSLAGWAIGVLKDRLDREREIFATFAAANGALSHGTDEAALRDTLERALQDLGAEAAIQLDASADATDGAPADGWRALPLQANDRDVGSASWRFAKAEACDPLREKVAALLVDQAAASIVRARLSRENSEMEFVARTEHLRTILLDAVSHHFRSPLAGIMGSVTSILNLPEQHDRAIRRELLLIIKEQAGRLNRYVDNFLSVARLESGSIDVNAVDLALEPLIYDVWETFGEAGGARRFLRVQVDPAMVHADPNLLQQVFGNVLENAIKYSPEESIVDVSSRRVDGRLVIDVADHGPGAPEASQARIFDRFFRSQGVKAPGLGLGLYITRSLVEMLGGSVAAGNRKDGEQGLVISIALPLAEGSR